MVLSEIFSQIITADTLGGLVLAAFFTVVGIILKGVLTNHGQISVARINSETSLGTKSMEILTTALEVLQEENKSLKSSIAQLEGHIDTLIEHILKVLKAKSQEEVDQASLDLEQFLRAIRRWPN